MTLAWLLCDLHPTLDCGLDRYKYIFFTGVHIQGKNRVIDDL